MPLIDAPLPDLAAWTARLRDEPIPVRARTARAIQTLAELEDARGCVDAQMLAEPVAADPFMTVALLAYSGRHRRASQITDAETATAAIMMMGIGAFFRVFAQPPTIEAQLADWPAALDGLGRVLSRSQRAAQFAVGFAVHRMDGDAAVIQQAALLHDFSDMLLWCHAPALALDIQARQQADPTLRSSDVQQAVLNTTLPALEQALMTAWGLPELLVQLTDDGSTHALIGPQRRTVQLAVRLARHSAQGWDNAALPDDMEEICDFLSLAPHAAKRLLHQLDAG